MPPVSELELGETTATEVYASFGRPSSERIIENRVGTFRILEFGYAERKFWEGVVGARLLRLELVDETVNAYVLLNAGTAQPERSLDLAEELQRGSTTQKEVRALLGEPDGRAMAPTAFESVFEAYDFDENWLYLSFDAEGGISTQSILRLGFNREGVLQDFGRVTVRENLAP
ncbi:MAG: hypothetical protein ACFB21_03380 [Opitutales bacterium]